MREWIRSEWGGKREGGGRRGGEGGGEGWGWGLRNWKGWYPKYYLILWGPGPDIWPYIFIWANVLFCIVLLLYYIIFHCTLLYWALLYSTVQ